MESLARYEKNRRSISRVTFIYYIEPQLLSMTIYLLDDDEVQLIYLSSVLEKNPSYHVVGKQMNTTMAIQEIQALKPDLLILDIELEAHNGIEICKSLQHKPFLILCTSHLEFAIDAFTLNAMDYWVKPVSPERIFSSLARVENILQLQQQNAISRELNYQQDSIFVKEGTTYRKLAIQDLMYIESLGDFSEFHLQGQQKVVALVNLKTLELQLPSTVFLRISRMHIININHVERINTQDVVVKGKPLSIGKTYTDTVLPTLLASQLVIKRKL